MINIYNMDEKEKDIFVKKLWEEFGNIILDEDDRIAEDFYIWKEGTDRDIIWHWFDDNYSNGLARGLMGLE